MVESGHDEEDGVGAGDDGFVNLKLVNHEVLSEKRAGGLFRDAAEVGEGALEKLLVGEDGHAGGSAIDVGFGLFDRVEVGIDDAGGGRGFFDFGNDAQLVGAAVEGGAEAPEVIALQGSGFEVGSTREEEVYLGLFVGDDFSELIHGGGREKVLWQRERQVE